MIYRIKLAALSIGLAWINYQWNLTQSKIIAANGIGCNEEKGRREDLLAKAMQINRRLGALEKPKKEGGKG